jgi:hypothetical protein
MQLATRLVGLSARLLIALAAVCLLLGGYLGWQTLSFSRDAIPAIGEVVSYHEIDDDGRKRYRPRVRFETATGDIVTVHGQMAYTSQRLPVGSRVPVMYQAADPMKARIARFFDNWLGSAVAAVVGLVSLVGGLFIRRYTRRAG